jgi:hypothetical protein
MRDDARRAAEEIPAARFVSLPGHSHISAFYETDGLLLPRIIELRTRHPALGLRLRADLRGRTARSRTPR